MTPTEATKVIRELTRAKALFQARRIAMVIGAPVPDRLGDHRVAPGGVS